MDRYNEKIIARQRDRTIAAILEYRERELPYIDEMQSRGLRKVVLDQVNDLANLCLDLLDGAAVNEYYIEALDKIYEAVTTNGKQASTT